MNEPSAVQPTLGIDLGAVHVRAVLRGPQGHPLWQAQLASRGQPLQELESLLAALHAAHPALDRLPVAVTGSGAALVCDAAAALPLQAVNEVLAAAQEVAAAMPDTRTLVDFGGQFTKWVLLIPGAAGAPGRVVDFATNGLCAAGSGAFLEQQAGRLGLGVAALGALAAEAKRGATVAGRCSVFAKSDMIHLQQQGTPQADIAYGLCQALIRTFLGSVVPGRTLEPPVVLVGGGARNPGLLRALRESLPTLGGEGLRVAPNALLCGALGAARLAAAGAPVPLAALREALATAAASRLAPRPAAGRTLLPLTRLPDDPPEPAASAEDPAPPAFAAGGVAAFLGVDVGSVSTNLVLLSPTGDVLQGIYLPTRGAPVAVLHEGLGRIRDRFGPQLQVLGVGTTGSGRHLAAQALGADVVHNEITAQLVSAAHYVPAVDTIFEIGGQDAKYIAVSNGRLADFEMNKICAAGTGSFLEEQAERLGLSILGEFAAQAECATAPTDLGTRCTVFMDAELVRAQHQAVPRADLCAGLAYAVARNYLEKVVAGRPVGQTVVFQGGTASNRAVVRAFRHLLGRPLRVHPYNRLSGALGAALLAARAHAAERYATHFRGLSACAAATSESIECRACENRCQVSRIRLGARTLHFGDACERYAERDRAQESRPRPFPELFAARAASLHAHVAAAAAGPAGRPRLGLLRASLGEEWLPFFAALLTELGFAPVVLTQRGAGLLREFAGGVPGEVCLPIKAAVAEARALLATHEVERVFVPGLLEVPARPGDAEGATCLYTQQLPDMVRTVAPDRVIAAQFALGRDGLGLVEPARRLAGALGRPPADVVRALRAAHEVQDAFQRDRLALGRRALASDFDRGIVVFGKPYNVHDPLLNLALARHLDRLGLAAIPADLLPLHELPLDERFASVPWFHNRDQLRAVQWMRRDGRLFPLFVSSYGCGPDGFTVKHLGPLTADRPRLFLEFDEHRGEAGLVTRLEAFADEIDEHLRHHGPAPGRPRVTPGSVSRPVGRRFFVPQFGPGAPLYVAALRGAGHDSRLLAAPDAETVRLGEAASSGRECHPFSVVAGELVQLASGPDVGGDDVFLTPGCTTPCLLRQYGDGFRLLLARADLRPVTVWEANAFKLAELLGRAGGLRLYEGLIAVDWLFTLAVRLRPYEVEPGRIDRTFDGAVAALGKALEAGERPTDACVAAAHALLAAPRTAEPGSRPVVGVTGDVYTRVHSLGNARLFERLEALGCEVWPSPYFGQIVDLSSTIDGPRSAWRGRFREALGEAAALTAAAAVRGPLARRLPPEVRALATEPPAADICRCAAPYVGPGTSYLVVQAVGKLVDFLRRGAAGAINAAGINCMVGTATAAVVPAIRRDHHDAPVLTLLYGGVEGPAQRLRLETFVEQVRQRGRAPFATVA